MSVQSPSLNRPPTAAPMPDALQMTLRAASRRIRLLMLLRYESRALCWSAVAGLVVVGLSKLRLFETPSPWALAGLIGVALLVGLALTFARALTELDVAKLTERR